MPYIITYECSENVIKSHGFNPTSVSSIIDYESKPVTRVVVFNDEDAAKAWMIENLENKKDPKVYKSSEVQAMVRRDVTLVDTES